MSRSGSRSSARDGRTSRSIASSAAAAAAMMITMTMTCPFQATSSPVLAPRRTTSLSSSSSSSSSSSAFVFALLERRLRRRRGGDEIVGGGGVATSPPIVERTTTTKVVLDVPPRSNGIRRPSPETAAPPARGDDDDDSDPSPAADVDGDGDGDGDDSEVGWSSSSSSSYAAASWDRRHARSIDEGIRFKSLLREGLETRIADRMHRERMLSDLLEGAAIGGSGTTTIDGGGGQRHDDDNARNNFLGRWLGLGGGGGDRGGGDDVGVGRDRPDYLVASSAVAPTLAEADAASDGATPNDYDGIVVASTTTTTTMEAGDLTSSNNGGNNNNRNFGARFISGLIVALAEEVKDLEVEVDADASTPVWEKRVDSIKVYFSRLGFRQLRMGGLDGLHHSELESSGMSGKFGPSASGGFFGIGKSDTADEAFDKIDVDKSGSLDVWELAQALKMAALIGGNKFGMRSREALTELAARLVRLYDIDGDGVVDRQEYQAMVQDMSALRYARLREETLERSDSEGIRDNGEVEKKRGWFSSFFGSRKDQTPPNDLETATPSGDDSTDAIDNEESWDSVDHGEGSVVLEGLKLDLRRLLFGAIPGVKRVLPGGPLILKPFTATITCSFNKDDIMDSVLLDAGLRRLVARALSRRVRGIRDLLDGAVFYGRTWKLFEKNAPQVEVAKLENVHFDKRNRLIITGRAKIKEALGYTHDPIEQGFKLRTKIGTRSNGRIIGLLEPEIAIFAECPKDLERNIRDKLREWFGYTMPTFQPLYTYIPLVSPLKKNDNMDGFNLGEDNRIKYIDIKNGKLRIEFSAFLRPGRFLGNHYLAFTVPNRTLILTLDRVREGMRNARRNKRLAELAAREVKQLADAQDLKSGGGKYLSGTQSQSIKRSISPEGKVRIQRLEKELKATIQEDAILREMEEKSKREHGKSFISRFVEGYAGAFREELDLEMNARLSTSISDFFGSQDSEGKDTDNT